MDIPCLYADVQESRCCSMRVTKNTGHATMDAEYSCLRKNITWYQVIPTTVEHAEIASEQPKVGAIATATYVGKAQTGSEMQKVGVREISSDVGKAQTGSEMPKVGVRVISSDVGKGQTASEMQKVGVRVIASDVGKAQTASEIKTRRRKSNPDVGNRTPTSEIETRWEHCTQTCKHKHHL
jgi:hypothetical protein